MRLYFSPLLDPFGMIQQSLYKRKMRSCLKSKDLEKKLEKYPPTQPQALLPCAFAPCRNMRAPSSPLQMSCSNSKVLLGHPRRSPMAALSHKFGWQRNPQYNAYLDSCIQAIYIGKVPPMETLMADPFRSILDRLKLLLELLYRSGTYQGCLGGLFPIYMTCIHESRYALS